MIELNDNNFAPTVKLTSPMLVMFHAKWAGPCNIARPVFEEVAKRRGNEISFMSFDLEDNPTIPASYNIRALPMFISFKQGVPVGMKAGTISAEIIEEMCDDL